jgi:hypothetical protein
MLTVEASMFHLQSIILSETFCGKNAEAAENGHIFQLVSVFQCSVTLQIWTWSIPSRCNQGWSLLCAWVLLQLYVLHCFGISVDLQNLVKIKGVPLHFLSSLYYCLLHGDSQESCVLWFSSEALLTFAARNVSWRPVVGSGSGDVMASCFRERLTWLRTLSLVGFCLAI